MKKIIICVILLGFFIVPLFSNASGYIFNKELSLGDSGPDIIALQQTLRDQGFFSHASNTGFFGYQTKDAIQKFQIAKGVVTATSSNGYGRVGPKTLQALNSPNNISTYTETTPTLYQDIVIDRDLYIGMQGKYVESLQIFLKNEGFFTHPSITGYFGKITKDAVIAFQTKNGINPIGKVGPATRAKILDLSKIQAQAPVISEVTPVTTPTSDDTPSYTFTTNEAGTITYGGSCSSAIISAISGSNTVTFNTLTEGTYSNCTIIVTDTSGNASNPLSITTFTIDTTAPTITNISSNKTNGTYGVNEVIDIDVTFSEAVTSTGNVIVTLETGTTDRTCTFTVSNSSTGTCNYTVQFTDNSADLTVASISGTIADQVSNAMTNLVPVTNLAANKALVISNYLVDLAPSPLVAYSNRQLSSSYAGPATQIRRSSDSTLSDIGFNAGDYDTSAFSTFVGGGTGYVRTWYDQSTNGVNALQTVNGNQLLVELNQVNSKPSLLNASGKDMSFTDQNLGTTYDIFGVFNLNSVNTGFLLGGYVGGPFWADLFYYDATTVSHGRAAANDFITYTIPKSSWLLAHIRRLDSKWASLSINGEVVGWYDLVNNNPITFNRLVSEDPSLSVATKLAEQIYYTNELTETEVQAISNNISNYYGINLQSYAPYVTPYSLELLDSNTEFSAMDGVGLVSFEGNLRLLGGWNTGIFPGSGSTNTDWQSTDGVTWTQNANAPWSVRHAVAMGVKDSKIWTFGGDVDTLSKDVWTYTTAGGWTQRTADWGSAGGNRGLYAWTIHDNSFYIAGGQSTFGVSPTMHTDIVRYNETTDQFEKMGDLPIANFSAGVLYSFNGDLYMMGGGRYITGGSDNYNNTVYKSVDDGATWELIATLPNSMRSLYPNGVVFDNKMWYLMGGYNGANQTGLYSSTDGINWHQEQYPGARHATGITVHNGALHIVAGNLYNDSWRVVGN